VRSRFVSSGQRLRRPGFTLIELLVVVAIVVLLVSILMPSLAHARLLARLAKVRGELYQIGLGLVTYHQSYSVYPHASDACMGGGADAEHNYSHLPLDLAGRYLMDRPLDPFNPAPGATYKYLRPGLGWQNNTPGCSIQIWVPKDFPRDRRDEALSEGCTKDRMYWSEKDCPVEFVVWSVGPAGPVNAVQSSMRHYPIPKRTWYHPERGRNGWGVIPVIKSKKHGFIRWEP